MRNTIIKEGEYITLETGLEFKPVELFKALKTFSMLDIFKEITAIIGDPLLGIPDNTIDSVVIYHLLSHGRIKREETRMLYANSYWRTYKDDWEMRH